MCEETKNNEKTKALETQQAVLASQRSDSVMLVFLLGILLSAVASTGLFVYREQVDPDFWSEWMPPVAFSHCAVLCVVSLVTMVVFVMHLTLQLSLATLEMPTVPSPIPILGLAIAFVVETPWECLKRWHERFGVGIFGFTLLGRTFLSISSPHHLKQVLQSKIRSVKKDVSFTYAPFMVILGKGIVTSEHQDWMKQRLKMSTALRIHVLDIIPRVTLQAVQRFQTTLDAAAADGTTRVDLVESLRHLTLQVISKTFLSISADESDSTFGKLYLPIVDECNKRVWHPYRSFCFFLPFWWRHLYKVHQLNSYVSNLIQTRWRERLSSGTKHNDILDLVLDSYEKDNSGGQRRSATTTMPRRAVHQIRDEFKTFMLAGHETSASMMTWALYELMGNDSLMKQVKEEGQAVFGKSTDWSLDKYELPPRSELASLECAEACLKESLRKYSVVPLVIRRVAAPLVLTDENDKAEFTVPKNARLALQIQAIHHNPKYWPDPMTFDPHRFMNDATKAVDPYTFLPFIEGPRNCLGQHLALLESKIVLGLLLQRYELSPCMEINTQLDGSSKDPRHQYLIPVTPKSEVNVTVKRRV